MRSPSSTAGRRWAATVGVAALGWSLALPGLALASPDLAEQPASADTAEASITPAPADASPEPSSDDPAAEPEGGVDHVEAPESCRELVSYTAQSTSGDARAVALTAQAIENGVEGWSLVAWEAAEDTSVSSVIVRSTTGETRELDGDVDTGYVEDVTGLVFCGERDDTEQGVTGSEVAADEDDDTELIEPAEETNPEADEPADAAPDDTGSDTDTGGATDADGSSDTDADESADAGDESATDASTDTETTEVRGIQLTAETPTSTSDEPAAAAADDVEAATAETEVLGVQLARTGTDTTALATGGLLTLLAGAALVLATGRREHTGGRA